MQELAVAKPHSRQANIPREVSGWVLPNLYFQVKRALTAMPLYVVCDGIQMGKAWQKAKAGAKKGKGKGKGKGKDHRQKN